MKWKMDSSYYRYVAWYTISVFIDRKRSNDVIHAVMQHWIGIFGVMGSKMTDNGGEFSTDEMREIMSILNA